MRDKGIERYWVRGYYHNYMGKYEKETEINVVGVRVRVSIRVYLSHVLPLRQYRQHLGYAFEY